MCQSPVDLCRDGPGVQCQKYWGFCPMPLVTNPVRPMGTIHVRKASKGYHLAGVKLCNRSNKQPGNSIYSKLSWSAWIYEYNLNVDLNFATVIETDREHWKYLHLNKEINRALLILIVLLSDFTHSLKKEKNYIGMYFNGVCTFLVIESSAVYFFLRKNHSSLSKKNMLQCWKHVLVCYNNGCL